MEYTLKINEFEGPLDLLLHLIKESKMDIFNLKVNEITKSYLDYIKKMQQMNLDIASNYLVMASELIELKSKMLLPRYEEDEEIEEDPRENLVNRLIEYQKYKDLTSEFKTLEKDRHEFFTKVPSSLNEYREDIENLNTDVTLDDLMDAFKKFLERQKDNIPLGIKITKKEISIEERRIQIKKILSIKNKVKFFELFDILNKEYVVATFLAILEMVRKQEINIIQENNFDDIICEVVNE